MVPPSPPPLSLSLSLVLSLSLAVFLFVCLMTVVSMAMFQALEQHEEGVDTVINVTDRLISSTGDAHEMVKQAKYLAQVSNNHNNDSGHFCRAVSHQSG